MTSLHLAAYSIIQCFSLLKEALIEDFLSGQTDIAFPEITAQAKKRLRKLLSARAVDTRIFGATLAELCDIERRTILILSGLLRFEVLKLILTKRWHVHYGVNEKGNRRMAIPFKAKDVAADMTEFGHPDVALCFTQLSYYYSGKIILNRSSVCILSHFLIIFPKVSQISS